MNRNDCEEFLNEFVTVAVPHIILDRPFFITGILKEVTDRYLKLKIKDGYKQIFIDDILEIRRDNDSDR